MVHNLLRNSSSNDSMCLVRNHGGAEEVAQHFSSAKRKEQPSANSISGKTILWE